MKSSNFISVLLIALGLATMCTVLPSCIVATDGSGGFTVKPDPKSVEVLGDAAVRGVIRATK